MSQPIAPEPPPRNGPARRAEEEASWKVMLRMLTGTVAAVVSGGLGVALANTFQTLGFLFLPPLLILAVLIVSAIRSRRLGYVTGFAFTIVPFFGVLGLLALMASACGFGRFL